MGKAKDLTGLKFGRLTVIERAENSKSGKVRWKCKCECGTEIIAQTSNLMNGHTKSCGCLKKELLVNDLTGYRFGRLIVIERAENNKFGQTRWRCKCECGNETIIDAQSLASGRTQSCGCLNKEKSTVHNMVHTLIYRKWGSMKSRCLNPNAPNYNLYGGRGIKIYPAWIDDFLAFYNYVSKLEHFGEDGYTLDRIDNNGNYEPDNVRWSDAKTQGRNRRTNRIVEYNGVKMCLKDAAEKSGISYVNLKNRIRHGDTGDRLFRPVEHK